MRSCTSVESYGASRSKSGRGELDVEVVGHRSPLPAEDLRVVVALALQGGGDLHRLHRTAEDLGERAVDHALESLLETLQAAHIRLLPARQ